MANPLFELMMEALTEGAKICRKADLPPSVGDVTVWGDDLIARAVCVRGDDLWILTHVRADNERWLSKNGVVLRSAYEHGPLTDEMNKLVAELWED